MLQNDRQLANPERKLAALDKQISKAKARAPSAGNAQSIQSLLQMANQLREEIAQYRARQKRRAS